MDLYIKKLTPQELIGK